MDWIKKNYDRFALMLLAFALLVSSICLILTARGFSERFAPVMTEPVHGKKVTTLETEALEKAEASLSNPAAWKPHNGSLFVSRKYVAKRDLSGAGQDMLVDPFEPGSAPLHPPIPNEWFLQSGLADRILDADVLEQDADNDGFTNLDEYVGKTDPQNAAQHPNYLTKLRLKQFIRSTLRFKFEAESSDGVYQINKVDGSPSLFVNLNEVVEGTKYKVAKFNKKSVPNPRTGVDTDVLELTVENIETGHQVMLPKGQIVESPDQYARFAFLWDHTEFTVKKEQKFSLKPEQDLEYKLIDIRDSEAVIINLKTGDQIKVPRLD